MRTVAIPWGARSKQWAATFGDHVYLIEALAAKPPDTLRDATVGDVCALVDGLGSMGGLSDHECGVVASMHWHVDAEEIARVCILEHAHEQWTDGEMLALLETSLRPLLLCEPSDMLAQHHEALVRTRHLARGELRTRTWKLLEAMKADGKTPDNRVRWAVVKELSRQYAGWTTKGMAEDTQKELEHLERNGGPDVQPKAVH